MRTYLAAALALWLASQAERTNQDAVAVADFDEDGIAETRTVPGATSSDLIAAGDFNGDGHADIVIASPGSRWLTLLPGNGRGEFGPPAHVDVPGAITAMTSGEINRPDGVPDLIVGIEGQVLVFEGPNGAWNATPEVFPIADEVTDLRLGAFDRDYYNDLQITTRNDVMIVHGRDRKLSQDEAIRNAVAVPVIEKAVSRSAALTTRPPLVANAVTITVTSAADDGPGSLRQAILQANSSPGVDLIQFNIAGSGVQTITLNKDLPDITDGVTIDGYTQPGAHPNVLAVGDNAVLLIEINGNGVVRQGFNVLAGGTTIRGLVINRCNFTGIELRNGADNVVAGNFIGTSADGSAELRNGSGIYLENSPRNRIGGTAPADRNLILGDVNPAIHTPLPGFDNAGGSNTIQGNYIGTDASGTTILGTTGIWLSNANNTIGGTLPGAGNVISSNRRDPIYFDGAGANDNLVQGNFIGLTAAGNAILGNGAGGVRMRQSSRNTIGGTVAAARNILASAGGTVFIVGDTASGNLVAGNFIGTNAAGNSILPIGGGAGAGVLIDSASNNFVGGVAPGAGNLIAGSHTGVRIQTQFPAASANVVQGNFIGTNAAGNAALPNLYGIAITATSGAPGPSHHNTIGGATPGTGNVISGNTVNGIRLQGGDNTTIQGNYIGVAAGGLTALANQSHGVDIESGSNNAITGNIIANSAGFNASGVVIWDGTGNSVRGNSIYANARLGIDLKSDGVTPNAPGVRIGPNNLQNYPVISNAETVGAASVIVGSLSASPSTMYFVDLYSNPGCSASGNGEGKRYLGAANVTTDATGNASFSITPLVFVAAGEIVTATATDPQGNTSEFSACRQTIACNFSIAPANQSFGSAGGTGAVDVTATAGCDWLATASDPWITITSGASGTGNGTVTYSVAAGNARTGAIRIADQTFTISQVTATATTIAASSNPTISGTAVTISVTVTSIGGTPTGGVVFKEGGSTLDTEVLAGGVATFTTQTLSVGTHDIFAEYAGDGGFQRSTSSVLSLSVLPATVAINVNESIHVVDEVTVLPSAIIALTEQVNVADTTALYNTGIGTDIGVLPVLGTTGKTPVALTFATITQSGKTTLASSASGGTPPPIRFLPGNPAIYYDISTTAVYSGPITVAVSYDGVAFRGGSLNLFHLENGAWANVTTAVDPVAKTVTGRVFSLSPFAIFEEDRPPIGQCRNVVRNAGSNCQATATADEINNGSSDPDGDPITLTLAPAGPYRPGANAVTLTVRDAFGATAQCVATVTVVDALQPAVTATLTAIGQVGKNNGTFRVGYAVNDNCDPAPSFKAVMDIPSGATSFAVTFDHDDGGEGEPPNPSTIVFDPDRKRIQLQGKDESTLRRALATILADNGVAVAQGQQLRLQLAEDKKTEFAFSAGVLVREKGPNLTLRVSARDAAGNTAMATATPTFAPK